MKKYLTRGLLGASLALLSGLYAHASHIVGTDLFYTHVSGLTYKVTVVLYGDCGPMSAASFSTLPSSAPKVCIYDGITPDGSVSLVLDSANSFIEVTPLCTGDTSQCMSPSSTIPGIKKFTYSANYTLPHTSAVWRFVYQGFNGAGAASGRAAAITNITSASATMISLVDTLNNITYTNSSPDLTVSQQTFFCNSQHDDYTPGAVDPDADSMYITMTMGGNGSGSTTCALPGATVSYTGTAWTGTPISETEPLQVLADSFILDHTTGGLAFHPNSYQRGIVVYNIREYRGGTLVGTSQREMTVLVVNCASTFPCMMAASSSLGIPSIVAKTQIYPNPASEELTILTVARQYNSYTISNSLGQVVLSGAVTGSKTNLDIRSLPVGIYSVSLKGENSVKVEKFSKQ